MAQNKWTLSAIQSAVSSYVDAAKQANASWTPSHESISDLIEKIMKTVIIDGSFIDKLPELDGEVLPFGQAIEEYFVNLIPVQGYDDFESSGDEANTLKPYRPNCESTYYSERLGKKVFAITVDEAKYQAVMRGEGDLAAFIAVVMKRLYDSYNMWKYNQKKQILGNIIIKANQQTNTPLVTTLAKPEDVETGEAFVKAVKANVETASFASEGTSLGGTCIGAEDGLVLYVDKNIMPSIETDVLAGAFNRQDLAMPCTIKVVDGFGELTGTSGGTAYDYSAAYAVLVDPRGVKLHRNYEAVREQLNALGDYRNYFLHCEHTAFISNNTFIRVFMDE